MAQYCITTNRGQKSSPHEEAELGWNACSLTHTLKGNEQHTLQPSLQPHTPGKQTWFTTLSPWLISFLCVCLTPEQWGWININYLHYLHSLFALNKRLRGAGAPAPGCPTQKAAGTLVEIPTLPFLTSSPAPRTSTNTSVLCLVFMLSSWLTRIWELCEYKTSWDGVRDTPGRGTRHPRTHLSRVREHQTGSSHPRDHIETGLQHPKKISVQQKLDSHITNLSGGKGTSPRRTPRPLWLGQSCGIVLRSWIKSQQQLCWQTQMLLWEHDNCHLHPSGPRKKQLSGKLLKIMYVLGTLYKVFWKHHA